MLIKAMVFQLQYVSDIHLEFQDKEIKDGTRFVKPGCADYLALIGDIGIPERPAYASFLDWCSKNWKEVFWVPGNHEYYNYESVVPLSYDEKNTFMEGLARRWKNVHFLNRGSFDIGGIRILGSCLWSYIPYEREQYILRSMNDSRNILYEPGVRALPSHTRAWFERDVAWITEQIALAKMEAKELIILTHYLPSFRLIHPKYEGSPINTGFATNLEHLMEKPVRAWLCGHSHSQNSCIVRGVQCALNPHGYPGENGDWSDANRSRVLVIDS